ncbi:MAG: hypothetical protein Q8Q14_08875 [Gemmatimonadales bacterium]|nr:hypothetical protein [Gemmatimonadales bacterium]
MEYLETLQRDSVGYFLTAMNPDNGLMIENHRSELLWRLRRECPAIVAGLRRAGFHNGSLRRGKSKS